MGKLTSQNAFSLVELLVTAAIMAYSLSVILTTYNNSALLNEASRNQTSAIAHANVVMEEIRGTNFNAVAANITAGIWNWNAAAVTTKGLTALNTESIATTFTGTNPLTITVTVAWKNTKGANQTRTLKTMMSG